jgi:uncharacterized protein YecE (DUF72 family)
MPSLFLGAPMWGYKPWVGSFFPKATRQKDFLREYSRRLNTVEGNTTFYALPDADTVTRWRDEASDGFAFCLKVPKRISHELRLTNAHDETGAFVDRLRLLGAKCGPAFLQLPPSFSARNLPELQDYLRGWPSDLELAVEPRHTDFFGRHEAEFDALLRAHGMARGIFDTTGLFATAAADTDAFGREARDKKPRFPFRDTRTAAFAFVRFVGPSDVAATGPWLAPWVERLTHWLGANNRCYFFCHAPDDVYAPTVCQMVHTQVAQHIALTPLPAFDDDAPSQPTLF